MPMFGIPSKCLTSIMTERLRWKHILRASIHKCPPSRMRSTRWVWLVSRADAPAYGDRTGIESGIRASPQIILRVVSKKSTTARLSLCGVATNASLGTNDLSVSRRNSMYGRLAFHLLVAAASCGVLLTTASLDARARHVILAFDPVPYGTGTSEQQFKLVTCGSWRRLLDPPGPARVGRTPRAGNA
jgi:hypothetical protein